MARFINPLYFNNHLDANIADEIKQGTSEAVNSILRLYANEEIVLIIPQTVRAELLHSQTPADIRSVANDHLFTLPVTLTDVEREDRNRFVMTTRGDAKPENIDPDLCHVWEAAKYGGGYFITRDQRLLARSSLVSRLKQIEIVLPESFLERVAEARALHR